MKNPHVQAAEELLAQSISGNITDLHAALEAAREAKRMFQVLCDHLEAEMIIKISGEIYELTTLDKSVRDQIIKDLQEATKATLEWNRQLVSHRRGN